MFLECIGGNEVDLIQGQGERESYRYIYIYVVGMMLQYAAI